jgi:hypothetical protein
VNGIRAGTTKIAVDILALVKQARDPGNPVSVVGELAGRLFPIDLTAGQVEYLIRNVLIPGLPDYEWTTYWSLYTADPTISKNRDAVVARLNALLKFMLRMAEFQLA